MRHANHVWEKYEDFGSDLRAKIAFRAESVAKVPKFWLRILAGKKCAKTFGTKFGLKHFGIKFRPKFSAQKAISARR